MESIKNFANYIRSNWYFREPVYDSSVRAPKSFEGYILGLLAFSFFFLPLAVGVASILFKK